ncbi:hypothetical protein Emed_007023 [Eimeria media]
MSAAAAAASATTTTAAAASAAAASFFACMHARLAPEGPTGYLAQHALLEQLPFLAKEAPPPDLAVACTLASRCCCCCCCRYLPLLLRLLWLADGLLPLLPVFVSRLPACTSAVAAAAAAAGAEGELTRLVWIGPKGTVSPLHTDSSQNLFVQVVGSKRMQLYPPSQTKALYPFQNVTDKLPLACSNPRSAAAAVLVSVSGGLLLNTSSLPASLVEARCLPAEVYRQQQQAFPLFFEETDCLDAAVNAGDILFIPQGWWHFVKAETPSVLPPLLLLLLLGPALQLLLLLGVAAAVASAGAFGAADRAGSAADAATVGAVTRAAAASAAACVATVAVVAVAVALAPHCAAAVAAAAVAVAAAYSHRKAVLLSRQKSSNRGSSAAAERRQEIAEERLSPLANDRSRRPELPLLFKLEIGKKQQSEKKRR